MAKNLKCAISDSALCRWIDKDCAECHINSIKHDEDVKKALESFEVTLSLLPDDIDELMGEECQFCKGEKRKRAGYALADLAHAEPKTETGMFFGFGKKIRRKVGSIMPLSISICAECRRALRVPDIIKWTVPVLLLAAAVIVLSMPSITKGMGEWVLLAVLAGALLGGYLIGKAAAGAYMRSKSSETRFNVFEIPICSKMKEAGWFTMQDDTPATRFIFSRKPYTKMIKSVCAGENEGAGTDS